MTLPILYSFRRCPYAMRARLALLYGQVDVEHREILLKNKPPQMLEASPKGTVPVLILGNGDIIDESLDVALWALNQSDSQGLLCYDREAQLELIYRNDEEFKYWLDRYKYFVGYPEQSQEHYRREAEKFLVDLEQRLDDQPFLFGDSVSMADIAIFPFVRQFAFVDKNWFDQTDYSGLHRWFAYWIDSDEFAAIMVKHPEWLSNQYQK